MWLGKPYPGPGLLLLSLAFGAYAFQWVSLMIWLPTFVAADMGATPTTAALLTASDRFPQRAQQCAGRLAAAPRRSPTFTDCRVCSPDGVVSVGYIHAVAQ